MEDNRFLLEEKITYFLSQGKEGEYWDYKREWHSDNEELVKDIICFANTFHDKDCYLIIGIADDLSVIGVECDNRRKQADVLDILSAVQFAGDVVPEISIEKVSYKGAELDVLIIYNTDKTPIYLKKKYGKELYPGCVYSRQGDRNTPDNCVANIDVVEKLWKKRFGLLKEPLDFIFDSLGNKSDWRENEKGFYHKFKPEYSMEKSEWEEEGRTEFYSYTQRDEIAYYYTLDIKASGNVLCSVGIAVLDGGRLEIPIPEWGVIDSGNSFGDRVGYKYYVKDTNAERLLKFMYDSENGEQRSAFTMLSRVILFFNDSEEKGLFEYYAEENAYRIEDMLDKSDEYEYIDTGNEKKTEGYKKSLRLGFILNKLLEEYRMNEVVKGMALNSSLPK